MVGIVIVLIHVFAVGYTSYALKNIVGVFVSPMTGSAAAPMKNEKTLPIATLDMRPPKI